MENSGIDNIDIFLIIVCYLSIKSLIFLYCDELEPSRRCPSNYKSFPCSSVLSDYDERFQDYLKYNFSDETLKDIGFNFEIK